MMKTLSVVALALAMPLTASAAVLLSGNNTGGDYPGGVTRLDTGATYSWLAGSDADIINQDPNFAKLTDGLSEEAGGNSAVYGSWGGPEATVVFDLKNVYAVETVEVSARFIGLDGGYNNGVGLGKVLIWTSTNGENYTLWGGDTNIFVTEENRNTVLVYSPRIVDAQYVKIDFNRLGDAGVWHMQMVIGEVAIYGNVVPEPMSLGLLGVGVGMMMLRRR